jgi:phosphoglycolate phosphatase-like HAD superfamily hydrolase
MKAVVFDLNNTWFNVEQGEAYAAAGEVLPILRRLGVTLVAVADKAALDAGHLTNLGVDDHFHMVMPAHTEQGMTLTDNLATALSNLNASPSETIVVADRVRDMTVAKQGHAAKVIGVPHGAVSPQALRDAGADHVVSDIRSLLDVIE